MAFFDDLQASPKKRPPLQDLFLQNADYLAESFAGQIMSACSQEKQLGNRIAAGFAHFYLDYEDYPDGFPKCYFTKGSPYEFAQKIYNIKPIPTNRTNDLIRRGGDVVGIANYFPGWTQKHSQAYYEFTLNDIMGVSLSFSPLQMLQRKTEEYLRKENFPAGCVRIVKQRIVFPNGYSFMTGKNNSWKDMGERLFLYAEVRW